MSDADRIAQLEAEIAALRDEHTQRVENAERVQRKAESQITGANHRTRNLLASVRSLAAHTAEHARDVDDYIAHFDGRIAALARSQGMLGRNDDMRIDLDELVREELLSHGIDNGGRVNLSGPPVRLLMRTGEALGLAVHELTSNAVKFGALSHEAGVLEIHWREENGALILDWVERGATSLVGSAREGFGRQLIEHGLPFQLGAETKLEFRPEGVCCRISTPLSDAPAGVAP